ncbi:hypothetical protein ACFXKJ_31110, partial [Kitasatospora indigofera]
MKTTHSGRIAATAATALCLTLATAACASSGTGSGSTTSAVTVAGVEIKQDAALHAALPEAVRKAGKVRV